MIAQIDMAYCDGGAKGAPDRARPSLAPTRTDDGRPPVGGGVPNRLITVDGVGVAV